MFGQQVSSRRHELCAWILSDLNQKMESSVLAPWAVFFRISNIFDPLQILTKLAYPIHSLCILSYDRSRVSSKEGSS